MEFIDWETDVANNVSDDNNHLNQMEMDQLRCKEKFINNGNVADEAPCFYGLVNLRRNCSNTEQGWI